MILTAAHIDAPRYRPLLSTVANVTTVTISNYTNATNTSNASWDEISNTSQVTTWAHSKYHPYNAGSKTHPYDAVTYLNSVWYQAVTAGTIGYGQYTAYTFAGRAIAILTLVFGVCYVGLVIAAIEGMMELDGEESKALNAFEEHHQSCELEYRAAALIQSVFLLNVEANIQGIQGAERYKYMTFWLEEEIDEWKEFRRRYLVFKSGTADLKAKVDKLYTNATRSQNKHTIAADMAHGLVHRQDALQARQEKVEHSLIELDAKLKGLTAFIEAQASEATGTNTMSTLTPRATLHGGLDPYPDGTPLQKRLRAPRSGTLPPVSSSPRSPLG